MMRVKSQGEEEDQEDGMPNPHMEVSGDSNMMLRVWWGVYQLSTARVCPTLSGKLDATKSSESRSN